MEKYKSIWLTGQPGSGKTTLANLLVKELNVDGEKYFNIDGDDLRDLFQNLYQYVEESKIDFKRFIENNINIIYLEPKNNFYNQYNYKNFVPNLSILDYLYNNGNKTQLIK